MCDIKDIKWNPVFDTVILERSLRIMLLNMDFQLFVLFVDMASISYSIVLPMYLTMLVSLIEIVDSVSYAIYRQ